jgi:hypothetical protein
MPEINAFVPQTAPTAELGGRGHPAPGFIRLAACPRCASQGRALMECNGHLVAMCLRCGEEFSAPMATVEVRTFNLVGRGGQRVIDLAARSAA